MNHVDPTITHISLCTGYGGLDLGIRRVVGERLRTIAYSEIEAFACELLLSRMEGGQLDSAPIWPDLRTFPWEEFAGVSLISGGFPCPPFSAAGNRNADEDPRHLFPFILDGIRRARPTAVFLENVEGIVSAKLKGDGWSDPAGTPVLLHVLRELERVGYVAEAGLFSASVDAGAPHQRRRIFILAHRLGEGLEGWLPRGPHPQREALDGHAGCGGASLSGGWHPWPARPCEGQHWWEPSRVMANTSSHRFDRRGKPEPSGIKGTCGRELDGCGDGRTETAHANTGNPAESGLQEPEGKQTEVGQPRTEPQPERSGLYHDRESCFVAPLGRDLDGTSDRLVYAKLCSSVDDRASELRLLGNGVVPQCAAVAFHELACRLNNKPVTP